MKQPYLIRISVWKPGTQEKDAPARVISVSAGVDMNSIERFVRDELRMLIEER